MKFVKWGLRPHLSAWDLVGIVAGSAIIENGYGIAPAVLSVFATTMTGNYLWSRVK